MKNHYYVYILIPAKNSVFYVDVTNNLIQRVYEHKIGLIEGFTKKHNIKTLIYYEQFEDLYLAIAREKLLKK